MRRLTKLALMAFAAIFFTNAAYADQDCIEDKRTTFIKVMNGITNVVNALDPTVWIAAGIVKLIPGEHNNQKPIRYCEEGNRDPEKGNDSTQEEQS